MHTSTSLYGEKEFYSSTILYAVYAMHSKVHTYIYIIFICNGTVFNGFNDKRKTFIACHYQIQENIHENFLHLESEVCVVYVCLMVHFFFFYFFKLCTDLHHTNLG